MSDRELSDVLFYIQMGLTAAAVLLVGELARIRWMQSRLRKKMDENRREMARLDKLRADLERDRRANA